KNKNNTSMNILQVAVISTLFMGFSTQVHAQSAHHSNYSFVSIPERISELENKYNTEWQSNWIDRYEKIMGQMPDPRAMIREALNNKFGAQGVVADFNGSFDSENLYYVTFNGAASDRNAFTGWQHSKRDVISAVTLTDAALANAFQNFEPDNLSSYSGVYYSGYGESKYGVSNEVKILPIDIAKFVWEYDLQSKFTESSKQFWNKNKLEYSQIYKDSFGFSGFQAFKNNEISYEASLLIEAMTNNDFSLGQNYNLDIYSYKSNSILWIESIDNSFALLYIPGANKPFVEFIYRDDQTLEQQLRSYLVQQLKKPLERKALAQHFGLYDRQDGASYTGVDNALKGLADGSWESSYILYNKTLISGNAFNALADATQARLASDSDIQIKSDSEVRRDHTLRTISAIINFTPVLAVLAPEIGIPLDIALNTTNLGLSIDITATGDTLYERQSGVYNVVGSSVNVAASFIIPELIRVSQKLPFYTAKLKGDLGDFSHSFSFTNRNSIPIEYETLEIGDEPMTIVHPKTTKQIQIVRLANEPDVVAMSQVSEGNYVEVDFNTGNTKMNEKIHEGVFDGKKTFYSSEPLICF
ncbi:TPA: DUF6543 domain-containing protein, partial [Vibrio cholerae]